MKPEDTSQEELQRVLALKRHEKPPRQFFNKFAEEVMDRLQNPEPPPEPTLMQRLGLDFDTKPVLICLSGLAICGLLAFGLILSRNMKAPPPGNPTDPLGQRPIHGSAGGLDSPGLMPAPPVNQDQEQSGGGGEPITVAPDPGQRIPPRPRPAPVTPVNPGK
jgi:hypothetical protein